MPGILVNRGSPGSSSATHTNSVQWIDQQQYLIETYREIRASLSQLENEIDAARLRVTDWSARSQREPYLSRARSLSHASTSTTTTESSLPSCCSHESTGSTVTTTGSCVTGPTASSDGAYSSSSGGPPAELQLNAATLLTAFLMATASNSANAGPSRARTDDDLVNQPRQRCNRSASPST